MGRMILKRALCHIRHSSPQVKIACISSDATRQSIISLKIKQKNKHSPNHKEKLAISLLLWSRNIMFVLHNKYNDGICKQNRGAEATFKSIEQ